MKIRYIAIPTNIIPKKFIPIKYAGMGEKLTDLEVFHPDRMASRILGMGDILSVIEKAEGVLGKTSIGLVPEACFIVIAIKKGLGLVAKKDDGIGGLVNFDESVVGANNLEVEFEGEKYLLFGEYTIIDGERFIYVVEE